MTDQAPIAAIDGEVWVGRVLLTRAGAGRLLAVYENERLTFPGRADQLRAAMAEAYPETRKAA